MINIFLLLVLLLIVCIGLFYRNKISLLLLKRAKNKIKIKQVLNLDFKRKIVVIELYATEYIILCGPTSDVLLSKKEISDISVADISIADVSITDSEKSC